MAKNKTCEVCGESPAYSNGKDFLCETCYIRWVFKTFIAIGMIALIIFLITI